MLRREVDVVVLLMSVWVAAAEPAPARRVEASASAAALTKALAAVGVAGQSVCGDDCPPGLKRVVVGDVALALVPDLVRATGDVQAELALFGTVAANVTCAATPVLAESGALLGQSRGCSVNQLGGNLPAWSRSGASRALSAALSGLLDLKLRQLGEIDLLSAAQTGLLAPFAADPALGAKRASRCVQAVRDVRVANDRAVVGVDVRCDG